MHQYCLELGPNRQGHKQGQFQVSKLLSAIHISVDWDRLHDGPSIIGIQQVGLVINHLGGVAQSQNHEVNHHNIATMRSLGANRGIANPAIILSIGPWTFWLCAEMPKCNLTVLAQVTYQQGILQNANADWEDKSSPLHCFCQWLASQIHIHTCYWFIW